MITCIIFIYYIIHIYIIYIYACQPACQQEKCRNIRCLEYCWKFLFHKPNWISSHPHSILVLEWHGNLWFHINTEIIHINTWPMYWHVFLGLGHANLPYIFMYIYKYTHYYRSIENMHNMNMHNTHMHNIHNILLHIHKNTNKHHNR